MGWRNACKSPRSAIYIDNVPAYHFICKCQEYSSYCKGYCSQATKEWGDMYEAYQMIDDVRRILKRNVYKYWQRIPRLVQRTQTNRWWSRSGYKGTTLLSSPTTSSKCTSRHPITILQAQCWHTFLGSYRPRNEFKVLRGKPAKSWSFPVGPVCCTCKCSDLHVHSMNNKLQF